MKRRNTSLDIVPRYSLYDYILNYLLFNNLPFSLTLKMLMLLNLSLASVSFIILAVVFWIILSWKTKRFNYTHESGEVEQLHQLRALEVLRNRHEVPSVLLKLFEHDGAGTVSTPSLFFISTIRDLVITLWAEIP